MPAFAAMQGPELLYLVCFPGLGVRRMRRREFITLFGGAAVAWPFAARAQQPALPVIGFLRSTSIERSAHLVAAFRQGLKESGYIEGQNVAIEYRSAEGQYDRLPGLAEELVRRQAAVIVATGGDASALAAKAATSTIPIVFTGEDPIRAGLVASLNHPGGNITGVNLMTGEAGSKRLGLLRELVPKAATIAVLFNPSSPGTENHLPDVQSAARSLGLQIRVLNVTDQGEIDAAFGTLARERPDALFMNGSGLTSSASGRSRDRVPKAASISPWSVTLSTRICRPRLRAADCTSGK